jgi:hypothetical protein
MRLSTRSNVDLPQPEGPITAVTLFWYSGRADRFQSPVLAIEEIEVADRDFLGETGVAARPLGDRGNGDGSTHGHDCFPVATRARAVMLKANTANGDDEGVGPGQPCQFLDYIALYYARARRAVEAIGRV